MPAFLARQRDVLRASRSFGLLFTSTLISGLGTWVAVIALSLDVYARTDGSGRWIAALLIADFLPAVAIGLLLGPLVDRLSRKRLLVGADVVRLAVFVLLMFVVNEGQIVALAFVAGVASGFSRPAAYAGLPNLAPAKSLPQANSLLRTADQLTIMFGTLIGGVIVGVWSPDVAYGINAVSFLVSAVLLLQIPGRLLQEGHVESKGHWADLAEGFDVVRKSRALLTVLVSWNLAMMAIAFVNVGEVFLARKSYGTGSFGFGLMWTASGAGAVIGALFASSFLARRTMMAVYTAALGLMAFGDFAAALAPTVWVGIWFILIQGIGNSTAIVCNSLLVQRGAPDAVRGRAFTLIMGSNFAVLGIGMAIAGSVVDAIGARWTWGIAAGLLAVAAICGYAMLRREPAAVVPEPVPS